VDPKDMTPRQRRALEALRGYFVRNGYVRTGPDRRARPTTHRGHELRFSADDWDEMLDVARCLGHLGIDYGKPFQKGPAWRIPVYGRERCVWLLAVLQGER
jgi:hypothetical protein